VIAAIQQGLKDDGFVVSISQLCRWFEVPRRTAYYKPSKAAPQVKPELIRPIQSCCH
jgi:putative transposase